MRYPGTEISQTAESALFPQTTVSAIYFDSSVRPWSTRCTCSYSIIIIAKAKVRYFTNAKCEFPLMDQKPLCGENLHTMWHTGTARAREY